MGAFFHPYVIKSSIKIATLKTNLPVKLYLTTATTVTTATIVTTATTERL